ncbi:hypothetical protein AB852_14775 [Streptomyces uncialis]|uniref:Uncharacterized protein n=1 Tax=Streptomyces uncialis TaxID=1048205 RepID=A0A1Q4V800_9ACTN|nr:hypothetical protein AB852_14775 [Streptomyces uncialis]
MVTGTPVTHDQNSPFPFRVTATCPDGTTLTGGGWRATPSDVLGVSSEYPDAGATTWTVELLPSFNATGTSTATVTAYALCLPTS